MHGFLRVFAFWGEHSVKDHYLHKKWNFTGYYFLGGGSSQWGGGGDETRPPPRPKKTGLQEALRLIFMGIKYLHANDSLSILANNPLYFTTCIRSLYFSVIPDENDDDTMPCWAGQSVYGEPDAYDVTNKDYGNANELDPPGYFQQSPSYQGQEEEVPDYKDNTPQDSRCCEGVTPEVDAAHRVPRHAQSDGYANEQLPTEQGRSGIHVRGTSGIHVRGGDAPDNDQEELEYEARRRSSEDSDDDDEKELSAEEQMRKLFAGDFRRLPPMDRTSVRILLRASPSGWYAIPPHGGVLSLTQDSLYRIHNTMRGDFL